MISLTIGLGACNNNTADGNDRDRDSTTLYPTDTTPANQQRDPIHNGADSLNRGHR
ncbi:hypothetical protein FPE01S_01_04540 [Flavihumibacter petaseus NBRC 106054]|uniref:Uncharacterized protein n=2 Tax=Flavihumibacter TaxID=1004301 RepID=A0A0E9MUM7_9BACT|nr:hypothetical protein FPE01S_01_04540 [Flavihumibacter petaseus NBRC 106054]